MGRYERKFVVNHHSQQGVEAKVRQNPAFFTEIFQPRFINNIYLDTHNLTFFHDNHSGKSQRKKIRIRWYGELTGLVKNPLLEYKMKDGFIGTKKIFPLRNFYFDDQFSIESLSEVFRTSDLSDDVLQDLAILEPTLVNRYCRKYFRSYDKRFRLTLDKEMSYYSISRQNNTLLRQMSDNQSIVVEVKYDEKYDKYADSVTSPFPFRMTKNSKYVNGISYFHSYSAA